MATFLGVWHFRLTAPAKTKDTCLVDCRWYRKLGCCCLRIEAKQLVPFLSTAMPGSHPSSADVFRDLACSHLLPGSRRRVWWVSCGWSTSIIKTCWDDFGMDDSVNWHFTHPPPLWYCGRELIFFLQRGAPEKNCQHHNQVVNRLSWCVPTSTRRRRRVLPCLILLGVCGSRHGEGTVGGVSHEHQRPASTSYKS